ncbi:hypothetical protein EDD37DRAFT_44051 [Exophiala viscosa]|uniref:uncharacterized protein n=1 Tax=Exophiala viscosa TaxID=2486360 RepID=UPI0021971468|nr:hypothetical protein EDD37DRAFT_44051 [Exophiala viscosa]
MLYIGQGQVIRVRISQHKENIDFGYITSLHYYIILSGGKSRTTNFIRLYRLHSDSLLIKEDTKNQQVEQLNEVRRTLLELLMTLAFQTLPAKELRQWLPNNFIKSPFRTLHLNVLNPLYQIKKGFATVEVRQASRDQLLSSDDPQLALWPDIRKRQIHDQKKQQTQNLGPYPKLSQMGDILQTTLEDNRYTLGDIDIPIFPLKPLFDQIREAKY